MGEQIVKIIRDGDGDIRTTDDVNFSLTSQYQNLKVFAKGETIGSAEVEHGLGFPPAFDVYVKSGGKYYSSYFNANPKGIATPSAIVSVDENKFYTDSAVVFLIYANPLYPAIGNNYDYSGQTGIRLAKAPFPLNTGIGVEMVNTHLQMPLIVQRGQISVTVPEIFAPAMSGFPITAQDTTTVPNPLGKAVHIISDNLFTQVDGYDALRGELPWNNPLVEDYTGFSMWINDSEIGLNAFTTVTNGMLVNDYTRPETTYTVDYILTNIKLP